MLLLRSFEVSPDRSMVQNVVHHDVVPPKLAEPAFTFISHMGFSHPNTRTYAELLGPCFKTGRLSPFCQHQEEVSGRHPGAAARAQHCTSATPCQPLRTSEPCLEAPPLLAGFYRPPQSARRPSTRVFNHPQAVFHPPAFLSPTQANRC